MYNDDRNSGTNPRELVLDGIDLIESVEELLRKHGFFDVIVPQDGDQEVLAN